MASGFSTTGDIDGTEDGSDEATQDGSDCFPGRCVFRLVRERGFHRIVNADSRRT